MRFLRIVTAFIVVCAASASGQVINVDFDEFLAISPYEGLAAASDPAGAGAVWNRVTGTGTSTITANHLEDSFGEATNIGISLTINGSYLQAGQQEIGPGGMYEDLMSDYVYLSAATNTVVVTKSGTLSGLDNGQLYDVYLYAQGDNFIESYSPGQNAIFTVDGVSKQTSWDGTPGGDGLLAEGIEFVKFRVVPNAQGEINFSWANVISGPGGNVAVDLDGNNSRFAVINGLQIVAVPEPSSVLLGSTALLGLLRRRR